MTSLSVLTLNFRSSLFDVQVKPMINEMTADEIRALLKLEPHATCGFVRVTFMSEKRIAPGELPPPPKDVQPVPLFTSW